MIFFRRILFLLIGLCSFCSSAFADTSQKGFAITYPLIAKDPGHTEGYRVAFWYLPQCMIWSHLNIYFDLSFGHWWLTRSQPHRMMNIYAFAPTLRYYFKKTHCISPYAEASIGLSYLSNTRFDSQNLGMHFAFQDQIAIGTTLGKEQRLSLSLSAMHYSNGSLCRHNSGITIPLLINAAYSF